MALVASCSSHSTNFSPDLYDEWPQLTELCGYPEPRPHVSILVRNVSYVNEETSNGEKMQLILDSDSIVNNYKRSASAPSGCNQRAAMDDVKYVCEQSKSELNIDSNCSIEEHNDLLLCEPVDQERTGEERQDIPEMLDNDIHGQVVLSESFDPTLLEISDSATLPEMSNVTLPEISDNAKLLEITDSATLPEMSNNATLIEMPDVTLPEISDNAKLLEITDSAILPEMSNNATLIEMPDATLPEIHEDNSISATVSKPESPEIDHTNEKKTCQTASPKKSKKKRRFKKIRQKSMGVWREFDNAELGFRVSKMSNLPDEDLELDDVDANKDDSSTNDASGSETLEECLENTAEICNSDDIAQYDADSVDFFRSLGIDVLDFEYNDEGEDFLQWDRVRFLPKRPASKPAQKPKPGDKPKIQSKLKTEIQPGPSIPADLTVNEDDKVNSLSPSTTVFSRLKKCDSYKLFELECSSSKRFYIRRDRDRKQEKPHKAVKSKNSRFVLQNMKRKRMYMHHRLIKMHNLDLYFRAVERPYGVPPMPKVNLTLHYAKCSIRANRRKGNKEQHMAAQNLNHALHETNQSGHLEFDLASFLISLQHREMTPEDYDMLLRLDDTVKPKTVSKNVLDSLRTETIGPNGAAQGSNEWEPMCTICMEPYSLGQERKFLPCEHDFHTPCIDKWLQDSSLNCPLDGLPIESL